MGLPLSPPIKPQLALTRKVLPEGEDWAYEPKLDGFRAIVFVDGEDFYIQSRGGKPFNRYFPELSFAPGRWVLDGELVIRDADGNLEFDSMQERIHPARSRIEMLAEEIPASYIAFDLLAEGDEDLCERPLRDRRERLEAIAQKAGLELTMLSSDADRAERWLNSIEGVMAKDLTAPYVPGKRKGMAKVKRERTIDCVVMGWRPGKEEGTVGSLILGLYDERHAAHGRSHLRLLESGETEHARNAGAPGDGRERQRGAEPVDRWARAGVGRAAAGAGDRGRLRPRGERADTAWGSVSSVPGRQRAGGVSVRAVG